MQATIENNTQKTANCFNSGYYKLNIKQAKIAKLEVMKVLGITSRASFLRRKIGDVNHSIAEREAIEKVFRAFGVLEIWGE